jgi:hypothetical protein
VDVPGKSVLVFYAPKFHGAISGCFGPHLHTFVEQEKLELRKFNDVLRPKDDTVSDKVWMVYVLVGLCEWCEYAFAVPL